MNTTLKKTVEYVKKYVKFDEAINILKQDNNTKIIFIENYGYDYIYENNDYPVEDDDDLIEMNEDNYITNSYKLFIYVKKLK